MADPFSYIYIALALVALIFDAAAIRILRRFTGGTPQALAEYAGWTLVPIAGLVTALIVTRSDPDASFLVAIIWIGLVFATRIPQRRAGAAIAATPMRGGIDDTDSSGT